MSLFRSRGDDREPVQVEHTVVPHEPPVADQATIRARIDAALRFELTLPERSWVTIDLLLDARNGETEPPLPRRRSSVPVIPGRS